MNCKREIECCRPYTHCCTCQYNEIDEEVTINQLVGVVKLSSELTYIATNIFIIHPLDLMEIDMSEIPCNCYFVSTPHINKGEMLQVDGDLKKELYKFIEEHPDKVFRGKK